MLQRRLLVDVEQLQHALVGVTHVQKRLGGQQRQPREQQHFQILGRRGQRVVVLSTTRQTRTSIVGPWRATNSSEGSEQAWLAERSGLPRARRKTSRSRPSANPVSEPSASMTRQHRTRMVIGLRPSPQEVHCVPIKNWDTQSRNGFSPLPDASDTRCPMAKDGSVQTPVSAPLGPTYRPTPASVVRRWRQSWAGMVAVSMTKR